MKTIKEIQEHWDLGLISRAEAESAYFDCVAQSDDINKAIEEIPSEFRFRVFYSLRDAALYPEDKEVFFVMGGIYSYELEKDPIKKAQMKKEVDDREKAERDHYNNVIRPKIRSWWAKRSKRK